MPESEAPAEKEEGCRKARLWLRRRKDAGKRGYSCEGGRMPKNEAPAEKEEGCRKARHAVSVPRTPGVYNLSLSAYGLSLV